MGPWSVRDPLLRLPVPLRTPDLDVALDLAEVFTRTYDGGGYRRVMCYGVPLPIAPADCAWAEARSTTCPSFGRRVWIEIARRSIGPDVHIVCPLTPTSEASETASARATAVARPVRVKVPHDEFREPFVEIFTRGERGKRLVTSLEVLSLSNKTPGAQGQDLYRRKQRELLAGQVHLVEIDVLRAGEHTTAVPLDEARAALWLVRLPRLGPLFRRP